MGKISSNLRIKYQLAIRLYKYYNQYIGITFWLSTIVILKI